MTGRCPTPSKTAYHSRGDAVHAAKTVAHSAGFPMRPYRCDCGSYHLSSSQPWIDVEKDGR